MSQKILHTGDTESPNLRFVHFKLIIGYVKKDKPKQIDSVSDTPIPLIRNAGSQPFKQYSLGFSKDLTPPLSPKYYKIFEILGENLCAFYLEPSIVQRFAPFY